MNVSLMKRLYRDYFATSICLSFVIWFGPYQLPPMALSSLTLYLLIYANFM